MRNCGGRARQNNRGDKPGGATSGCELEKAIPEAGTPSRKPAREMGHAKGGA